MINGSDWGCACDSERETLTAAVLLLHITTAAAKRKYIWDLQATLGYARLRKAKLAATVFSRFVISSVGSGPVTHFLSTRVGEGVV